MQAQARVSDPQSAACRRARDDAAAQPTAAASPMSRALVPLHPVDADVRPRDARYPSATFLAHLIAVDRRLPQMRGRGRAAPEDAAAVYSATLRGAPARTGRRLRRSA